MCWWRRQIRSALQLALTDRAEKISVVDPNDPVQLRNLAAEAIRDDEALTAVVNSVNRYSPTVYDISISDRDNKALLTTGTGGLDAAAAGARSSTSSCRDSNPFRLIQDCFLRAAGGL